ncbi:hypothetical protein [Sphingomonas faeni]|nr:hypothetical protein [Sphingomonas faeni]MDQ0838273.1 hypothetical protein [Sphingomonas faeni]
MNIVVKRQTAVTPAKAGAQLGDAYRLGAVLRYIDLSNWTPAFAGKVFYE